MTWKDQRQVTFSVAELQRMLEILSPLVVSLDKIGSQFANDPVGDAQALNQFSYEYDLGGRLSELRKVIDERLHTNLTREELDEIESVLENLPHWTPGGRS